MTPAVAPSTTLNPSPLAGEVARRSRVGGGRAAGADLPPGLAVDRATRRLVREGRAAKLEGLPARIAFQLVGAGGRVEVARLCGGRHPARTERMLSGLARRLAPLGLTLAVDAGTVALVDRGAPTAHCPLPTAGAGGAR